MTYSGVIIRCGRSGDKRHLMMWQMFQPCRSAPASVPINISFWSSSDQRLDDCAKLYRTMNHADRSSTKK